MGRFRSRSADDQVACIPKASSSRIRLHLDMRVGTGFVDEARRAALDAERARLVALGALRVRLPTADSENECVHRPRYSGVGGVDGNFERRYASKHAC